MLKTAKILSFVVLLTFYYNFGLAQDKNNPAIDFTLPDIYGEQVTLFDTLAEGKTVLLYFFSCSCVHCYTMAPIADSVFQRFGSGSENLTVWGIAQYYYNNEQVSDFIDSTGISFRCFSTGHEADVFSLYNITYTPQLIMICGSEASESIPQDMIVETLNYCFPTKIATPKEVSIYFNIIDKRIHLASEKKISFLRIHDITGRLLLSENNPAEIIEFPNSQTASLNILTIVFDDGTIHTQKIQVK